MWEDILEALAVGGSGAISGYQEAKELEAARAERERERQEAQAFRDAQLAMQRERLEMERAAANARERRESEEGLASGKYREIADVLNPLAVRQTIDESMKALEGPGDMFEDAGIGMAAKPAAGQTYAAQMQRQREQEREGIGRTPMSFLDEVPEFTPSETLRERGTRVLDGRVLRPTTPAERAAAESEFEETFTARDRDLLIRALEGDEEAQVEAFSRGLGDELESIIEMREGPEPEIPNIIRTEAGFGYYDPETGTIRPVPGETPGLGRGPRGSEPSGPAPSIEVDAQGNMILVDKITGKGSIIVDDETGQPIKAAPRGGGSLFDQIIESALGGTSPGLPGAGVGATATPTLGERELREWEEMQRRRREEEAMQRLRQQGILHGGV